MIFLWIENYYRMTFTSSVQLNGREKNEIEQKKLQHEES